jgi:hypothetical protein
VFFVSRKLIHPRRVYRVPACFASYRTNAHIVSGPGGIIEIARLRNFRAFPILEWQIEHLHCDVCNCCLGIYLGSATEGKFRESCSDLGGGGGDFSDGLRAFNM